MKKISLILTMFLVVFFMSSTLTGQATQTKVKALTKAKTTTTKVSASKPAVQGLHLTFISEKLDIGKMKKGEKKTFRYEFVNTGTEDIDFNTVSGCDCTTLDWPRNKIKPGKTGFIDVIFDSGKKEEKSGTVDVEVYLNNIDPKTKRTYFQYLTYKYEII
jgi:hypothetical protein